MSNTIKKIFSIILSLTMLISIFEYNFFTAKAMNISEIKVGDIIEFGSYPQSKVTDEEILYELNNLNIEWISYDYFSGDDNVGSMFSDSYMKYADVIHDGEKYRAVTFSAYRPYNTYLSNSGLSVSNYQDDNGYYINTVFWFKFEPIKWRVLDPHEGIILSETIIDSQAYSNNLYYDILLESYYNDLNCTKYANNYETSTIREWLNNIFYNTAFNDIEKIYIQPKELDNSAYSSQYDSNTTYDNVFLISYTELLNSNYGFSSDIGFDMSKCTHGSDYAKSQGLFVDSSTQKSYWWSRTSADTSCTVFIVDDYGQIFNVDMTCDTRNGIRPSLKLNMNLYGMNIQIRTPSTKSISYGDCLILNADIYDGTMTDDIFIKWTASNNCFDMEVSADGLTCKIIPNSKGDTTFTVSIVDANENIISSDEQVMTSKAGFFDKIIAFFKKLFGLTKTIPQEFKGII